jgi:hypothetical protein
VERADEILADGEWHDGRELIREMEKKIAPGVALRHAEADRRRSLRTRHGEDRDPDDGRPVPDLIRGGKRAIVRILVANRIRDRTWEADVWPVPELGWSIGGWKIRDLRPRRGSVGALATRFGVHRHRILDAIAAEPPVTTEQVGKVTYIYDLPEVERRLFRPTAEMTLAIEEAARARLAAQREAVLTADRVKFSDLALYSGIGADTAAKLRDEHLDDLAWETRGRVMYLPASELPKWTAIVEEFHAGSYQRRSAASLATNERLRREGRRPLGPKSAAYVAEQVPEFSDSALNDAYRAYRGGDTGRRSEAYDHFRRAFHAADEPETDGSDDDKPDDKGGP